MPYEQTEIPVPPARPTKPGASRVIGSKGGSGIAQWLISLMPPHRTYVEAFLGSGIILRTKLPAFRNIGIDLDGELLTRFETDHFNTCQERMFLPELLNGDALTLLPTLGLRRDDLVYADPPYPASVRVAGARPYYKHEALDEAWHERFLAVLQALPCAVMVSGYEGDLYTRRLAKWRSSYKWTVNRAGAKVREFVWMNFAEPALLHDPRFVGGNFTDRQRVKRKIGRWVRNFSAMAPGERWAIYESLTAVVDVGPPEFCHE